MVEKNTVSPEPQKVFLVEQMWLSFFNNYLYEKGIITEVERNHMVMKIENRKGFTSNKNRPKK